MEWTDAVKNYYKTKVLKIIDDTIADKERDCNDIVYELQCLKHKINLNLKDD
jgi:hypothetical protein